MPVLRRAPTAARVGDRPSTLSPSWRGPTSLLFAKLLGSAGARSRSLAVERRLSLRERPQIGYQPISVFVGKSARRDRWIDDDVDAAGRDPPRATRPERVLAMRH